ncbi:MAG: hypothetical protein GXY44_07470 [Phycisphaerales bacterium]|nr:hypothetical protein [Phycisphaerales bacterium]
MGDIEEIIDILKGTCEAIEIRVENMILDDINELTELKKEQIYDIHIHGQRPYICLDMLHYTIWLSIAEDTPESRGLFEKIKSVLIRCRRPLSWLLHPVVIGGAMGASIVLLGQSGLKSGSRFHVVLFAILFGLYVFWFAYAFHDWSRHYTIIIAKHRIDSPGLVKRNADKIILAAISAIIGAMITNLIQCYHACY